MLIYAVQCYFIYWFNNCQVTETSPLNGNERSERQRLFYRTDISAETLTLSGVGDSLHAELKSDVTGTPP